MRTPTSRTDRAPASAGFTLVELLAVLAILALAATAFSYGGRAPLESARFRALMVKTTAALIESHGDAIRRGEDNVFVIDVNRRSMGDPRQGATLQLPANVDVTATVAGSEKYSDGRAGIRFYPAGTSSGGTLNFKFRNQVYEIRVNWLTGNVTTHRS